MLPKDIAWIPLTFLTDVDISSFALTARASHAIARDALCWQSLLLRDFNIKLEDPLRAFSSYREKRDFLMKDTGAKLYRYYMKQRIFLDPNKFMRPDGQTFASFQGMYGIDFNEVRESFWFGDQKLSISYQQAFTFIISWLSDIQRQTAEDKPRASLKEKRQLHLKNTLFGGQMLVALSNIEHSKKLEQEAAVPRSKPNYVSWVDVILQVLKDKEIIFDVSLHPRDGWIVQI